MQATIEHLVRQAQRKDAAAFAQLIERFERTALALALSGTGDSHAAGDVTQEAFIRAWERLGSLKDPTRFGAWLAGIVRNLAADHRRGSRRMRIEAEPSEERPRPAVESEPSSMLAREDLRQRVNLALESLDELSRSAVVLRYYEGLSSREIAELLEVTPAAVDMRLMRARNQLRERLAGDVEETPEPVISLVNRAGGVL